MKKNTHYISRLDQRDWEINGNRLTAWANDIEMFDIAPCVSGGFALILNHAAAAHAIGLGVYSRIAHAQIAAQNYLQNTRKGT